MAKIILDNLNVSAPRMGKHLGVAWTTPTHRFHFWWDPDTGTIDGNVLHRNEPADSGSYKHTALSVTTKRWQPVIAEAIRRVREEGLEEAFEQAERDLKAQREAENLAAWRLHTTKEAGPALLAALQALLDWGREHTSPRDANSPHALLVAAAEAIELATTLKGD